MKHRLAILFLGVWLAACATTPAAEPAPIAPAAEPVAAPAPEKSAHDRLFELFKASDEASLKKPEVSIALDEHTIPVREGVRGACEILGLDPLTIANEGKLLAIVAPEQADAALAAMRAHPLGREAALIGEVRAEPAAMVFLRTDIGGTRVLDMLVGDPLPRIC